MSEVIDASVVLVPECRAYLVLRPGSMPLVVLNAAQRPTDLTRAVFVQIPEGASYVEATYYLCAALGVSPHFVGARVIVDALEKHGAWKGPS